MPPFIVFEGIDGSGKSSTMDRLDYPDTFITVEPTDSEIGSLAKRIAHEKSSPYLDMFLYLADRVEHGERIKEKLEEGKLVLCDRYWGSTAAYQAANDEISLSFAEEVQLPWIIEPDITVLFDIDPDTALKRISGREHKSKYEILEFLKRVRENYLKLAGKHNWKVIDAGKGQEEVFSEVKGLINKLLEDID